MKRVARFLAMSGVLLSLVGYAYPTLGDETKTVTIGYTSMLSGPYSKMGKENLCGCELAADEINAGGGVKIGGARYLIKIEALDDQYKAANSVANARRLMSEGIKIMWVFGSPGNLAVQEINQTSGKQFLILGMTDLPSATKRGNKLYVRCGGHSDIYCYVAGKAIVAVWPGIKKAAVVEGVEPASREWSEHFQKTWKGMGNEIVAVEMVNPKETSDFYPALTKILKEKPEIIVLLMSDEPSGLVIKQANELGYKGNFFAADWASQSLPKYCGAAENVNGRLILQTPSSFEDPERYAIFEKKFGDRCSGIRPGPVGADGYDGIWTVAHAMEKAGTVTDVFAIRKAWPEVCPIPERQASMIGYDETGNSHVRLVFGKYLDGKWKGVIAVTAMSDGTVKDVKFLK
jgi:branched-chain amino acid transport system substrate-binding protein